MQDRYGLLQRGLFPETLPPCFTSADLKRGLRGVVRDLNAKAFHKRTTDYVPYNGTKHDGSRRFFASPNPIAYFHVASFIAKHWPMFAERFGSSPFSVSQPKLAPNTADRPIIIPSLSELTTIASAKLRYCSHILKTDIAQFFPSIYTHSIVWSAHGIEAAKRDQNADSQEVFFNSLDFFVRNCQRGETRGILVGPDAFRLIAEYVAAGLDSELHEALGTQIVGAARHVDDYYIGVDGGAEALAALSTLRDILIRYSLNINDSKTVTIPGTEPLNELWAQDFRKTGATLKAKVFGPDQDDLVLFVTKALSLAREIRSDSPVKIALRAMDEIKLYQKPQWTNIEPYLQRIVQHHPHCIDYVALLVAKRSALGRDVDRDGWKEASYRLLNRHLPLNHHHEVVWLLWLLLSLKVEITDQLSHALSDNSNAHIRSLLVAAHLSGQVRRKPKVRLGGKLSTTDSQWLVNIVARAGGYSRASFSGSLAAEFEHLATKQLRLIDLKAHMKAAASGNAHAISRTKYGYDRPDSDDHDSFDDDWFNSS